MYFDSFADLIAMDGHGVFVWLAYASFLLIIVWNLLAPKFRRKQVLESAKRYWHRVEAQKTDANGSQNCAESNSIRD